MATQPNSEPPAAETTGDPFFYGWRYVEEITPSGRRWRQVSLTRWDVLHPQEDDHIMQNEAHQRRCRYLANVLEAALPAEPSTVVLQDVRITWDVPGLGAHGPDIMVILGVRERRSWGTFEVAVEGVRPALIIEVTSAATESVDRAEKIEQYALARVPRYILIDAIVRGEPAPPRLRGYTLVGERYEPLLPDATGRLALTPAPLWLGVVDEEIVCFTADGQPVGDYRALAVALKEAEERVAEAKERAAEAEERAATEAAARLALERRAAALEAELRRRRDE